MVVVLDVKDVLVVVGTLVLVHVWILVMVVTADVKIHVMTDVGYTAQQVAVLVVLHLVVRVAWKNVQQVVHLDVKDASMVVDLHVQADVLLVVLDAHHVEDVQEVVRQDVLVVVHVLELVPVVVAVQDVLLVVLEIVGVLAMINAQIHVLPNVLELAQDVVLHAAEDVPVVVINVLLDVRLLVALLVVHLVQHFVQDVLLLVLECVHPVVDVLETVVQTVQQIVVIHALHNVSELLQLQFIHICNTYI